jgi:hypothetical protein
LSIIRTWRQIWTQDILSHEQQKQKFSAEDQAQGSRESGDEDTPIARVRRNVAGFHASLHAPARTEASQMNYIILALVVAFVIFCWQTK